MTRNCLFLWAILGGLLGATAWGQTTPPRSTPSGTVPSGSGSYYGQKTSPATTQPANPPRTETQPIRRTAGELPVAGGGTQPNTATQPRPGNVIMAPPANGNPQPGGAFPQNGNPGANPANGNVPAGALQRPAAPFVLNAAQEKYVNDLLATWEFRSGQIQRFQCEFKRWEYDPNGFGPKDPNTARAFAKGEIKYQAPDKGMFKVTEGKVFSKMNGAQPVFVDQTPENLEHWVCDGKNVFEFDARNKVLRQRELPPDMQGQAIADGPLPFLFGAKAEKMKSRYFIRVVDNPNVQIKGVYWLEVYPRTRGDAASYKKVHVALDQNDFMPQILMLFPPNYDPQKNPAYVTFAFENKEANWNELVKKFLQPFATAFHEPKTPTGWKKVVEPFFGEATDLGGQAKKPAPGNPLLK